MAFVMRKMVTLYEHFRSVPGLKMFETKPSRSSGSPDLNPLPQISAQCFGLTDRDKKSCPNYPFQ
jgi:hypothetical protein